MNQDKKETAVGAAAEKNSSRIKHSTVSIDDLKDLDHINCAWRLYCLLEDKSLPEIFEIARYIRVIGCNYKESK